MGVTLGVVGNLISEVQDPKERATIKGTEIAKIETVPRQNVKFSGADYDIEVVSFNPIEGGVEVFARAWNPGGSQIGFGEDGSVDIERFRVFNPTILISDGTFTESVDLRGNSYEEQNLKEDLKSAILNEIAHTIKVKSQKTGSASIVAGKIGSTTSTFNPVSGANSPVDGDARITTSDLTFANIRSGAGTGASATETTAMGGFLEVSATADQFKEMHRSAFCFDTSAIGDTDTISSATFSLQGNNSFSLVVSLGAFECDIVSVALGSTADVASTDYAVANWGSTVFASIASGSITEEGAYNDFALNASGISNISKTGVSQFGTRINWDTDNSFGGTWSAGTASYWIVRTADHGSTPPKLVVEHTAPAATGNFFSVF